MALTTPDWLARHGGSLLEGTASHAWFVLFDGAPQYQLAATPVAGRDGCRITQTINGRRVESNASGPTAEDAVRAGLEDLRKALGW